MSFLHYATRTKPVKNQMAFYVNRVGASVEADEYGMPVLYDEEGRVIDSPWLSLEEGGQDAPTPENKSHRRYDLGPGFNLAFPLEPDVQTGAQRAQTSEIEEEKEDEDKQQKSARRAVAPARMTRVERSAAISNNEARVRKGLRENNWGEVLAGLTALSAPDFQPEYAAAAKAVAAYMKDKDNKVTLAQGMKSQDDIIRSLPPAMAHHAAVSCALVARMYTKCVGDKKQRPIFDVIQEYHNKAHSQIKNAKILPMEKLLVKALTPDTKEMQSFLKEGKEPAPDLRQTLRVTQALEDTYSDVFETNKVGDLKKMLRGETWDSRNEAIRDIAYIMSGALNKLSGLPLTLPINRWSPEQIEALETAILKVWRPLWGLYREASTLPDVGTETYIKDIFGRSEDEFGQRLGLGLPEAEITRDMRNVKDIGESERKKPGYTGRLVPYLDLFQYIINNRDAFEASFLKNYERANSFSFLDREARSLIMAAEQAGKMEKIIAARKKRQAASTRQKGVSFSEDALQRLRQQVQGTQASTGGGGLRMPGSFTAAGVPEAPPAAAGAGASTGGSGLRMPGTTQSPPLLPPTLPPSLQAEQPTATKQPSTPAAKKEDWDWMA